MARASHIAAMIPQIASGVATLPGTLNPYPYALNNPVNNTDPSGEFLDTILDFGFIAYDLYRIGADNIFGKEDNLNENLLSLGADVGGLAIPFCTGAGMVVRGSKVAKGVDRALGITGKSGKIDDVIRGAKGGLRNAPTPLTREEMEEAGRRWVSEEGKFDPKIHPDGRTESAYRQYRPPHVDKRTGDLHGHLETRSTPWKGKFRTTHVPIEP